MKGVLTFQNDPAIKENKQTMSRSESTLDISIDLTIGGAIYQTIDLTALISYDLDDSDDWEIVDLLADCGGYDLESNAIKPDIRSIRCKVEYEIFRDYAEQQLGDIISAHLGELNPQTGMSDERFDYLSATGQIRSV